MSNSFTSLRNIEKQIIKYSTKFLKNYKQTIVACTKGQFYSNHKNMYCLLNEFDSFLCEHIKTKNSLHEFLTNFLNSHDKIV